MTSNEFNKKYKEYLGDRHYGLDIEVPQLTLWLDEKFQEFIKIPEFKRKEFDSVEKLSIIHVCVDMFFFCLINVNLTHKLRLFQLVVLLFKLKINFNFPILKFLYFKFLNLYLILYIVYYII